MKILLISLCFITSWICVKGLSCWTCINAKSNQQCIDEGRLKQCQSNENACHNEIRRGDQGIRLTKRCKQDWACTNNEIQNPRHAWLPSQCNSLVPSSVCRCCCSTDNCNKFSIDCAASQSEPPVCSGIPFPRFGRKLCQFTQSENEVGSVCSFTCQRGYDLVGARTSKCILESNGILARFSKPTPRCVRKLPDCPLQRPPAHGSMNCTETTIHGRACTFVCDDFHVLVGLDIIECDRRGIWDGISPACVAVTCPSIASPDNGFMSCTYDFDEDSECTFRCRDGYRVVGAVSTTCQHILTEGLWSEPVPRCERKRCSSPPPIPTNGYQTCSDGNFLNSTCEYACESGYGRVGPQYATCVEDENGILEWDNDVPACEEIVCESQGSLRNGRVSCTNKNVVDSICSFECTTKDFELSPIGVTSSTCTKNTSWTFDKPCCSRICPPFSVVDLVIVIDSSSSIGRRNWDTVKRFVSSLINVFEIGEDAARIGVIRYNRRVDTKSQILLKDFPEDKTALLQAFDEIPYDGSGTYTGNALRYTRRVMLAPRNGNRIDVPDYVLVITDGKSRDRVKSVSRTLHRRGVHVIAVGVVPLRGGLDLGQLRDIVNHPDDLIVAESGFDDLNLGLFRGLVNTLCIPGCL